MLRMGLQLQVVALCIAFLGTAAGQDPAQQAPLQKPSPSPRTLSRSPLRMALPRKEYTCADGVRVVVLIETKAVRLIVKSQIYNLPEIEGGTGASGGAKYASGSVVWSSTGEEGFLVDNADTAHPKMLAEQCHLQSSFPPLSSAPGSIRGSAKFVSKSTLPSKAILIVQLKNLTKDADDSAAVFAEERLPVGGGKSPISFTLRYDPAKLTSKDPSAISASIIGPSGKLLFVLVKPLTIADVGNPGPISLALSRASSHRETPPLSESPPHL